jgi:nucleotide-binding universal stress UspA family protein
VFQLMCEASLRRFGHAYCYPVERHHLQAREVNEVSSKSAEKVILLAVDPKASPDAHGAEPGADAALWLSRHGVKVTVQRDVASDAEVGEVILSRAADHGADLIVMGIYGHSRLREWVLGGVSRTLLGSMTVPVLMSH